MTDLPARLIRFGSSLASATWLPSCYEDDLPKTTPKSLIQTLRGSHTIAKHYAPMMLEAALEIRRLKSALKRAGDLTYNHASTSEEGHAGRDAVLALIEPSDNGDENA